MIDQTNHMICEIATVTFELLRNRPGPFLPTAIEETHPPHSHSHSAHVNCLVTCATAASSVATTMPPHGRTHSAQDLQLSGSPRPTSVRDDQPTDEGVRQTRNPRSVCTQSFPHHHNPTPRERTPFSHTHTQVRQ